MLLQAFDGAIVAITHNKAFADNLRATHVLRVQVRNVSISYLFLDCITALIPYAQTESLLQILPFTLAGHWQPVVLLMMAIRRGTGVDDCSGRPTA